MTGNNYPLSTLPAPYELVWCRFPHLESLGDPGPYPRPALVRATGVMPDGAGEVEVVYGTTKLKLMDRRFDFIVSKSAEMDACGLYRATRFDLDRTIWLPWTTDWFEIRQEFFSPVIGKLTTEAIKMLQVSLSFKQQVQAAARAAAQQQPTLPLTAPAAPTPSPPAPPSPPTP